MMAELKKIIIVTNGESEADLNNQIYCLKPDHDIDLTKKGINQSREAGKALENHLVPGDVSFLCSTHSRAKQTLEEILDQLNPTRNYNALYNPLLREQERGFYTKSFEHSLKCWNDQKRLGSFYYRFPDGESGADVFIRASLMMNNVLQGNFDSNLVIITHDFFARVFLMAWLGSIPESFESLEKFDHGNIYVLKRTYFSTAKYTLENRLKFTKEICE